MNSSSRQSLYMSTAAALAFHALVLLVCSRVILRSSIGNWVAFTDVTVIGVAPLGEGLGKKETQVSTGVPKPAVAAVEKPAKTDSPQVVQLPSAQRGPTADQLASIRAAFPIGSEKPSVGTGPETVSAPIGYGDEPGKPGVPWGKPGVSGPLAQRAIRRQVIPQYPAWAREQGISGRVEVGIWVTPEGRVRDQVDLIKRSGYKELDDLVVGAVKKWEFEALPPVAKQEDQYGIVPLRFALTK